MLFYGDKFCHFSKEKFGETLEIVGFSSVNSINFVNSSMVKIDFSYGGWILIFRVEGSQLGRANFDLEDKFWF